MFSSACTVFVGAVPFTVVSVNNCPQIDPSPAVPPAELMHAASTFASEAIRGFGVLIPAGTFAPGAKPVVVLTRACASVNACARLSDSATVYFPVELDPIAVRELM